MLADSVIALMGIEKPTERQHIGAIFVTDFMLKVVNFLTPKE